MEPIIYRDNDDNLVKYTPGKLKVLKYKRLEDIEIPKVKLLIYGVAISGLVLATPVYLKLICISSLIGFAKYNRDRKSDGKYWQRKMESDKYFLTNREEVFAKELSSRVDKYRVQAYRTLKGDITPEEQIKLDKKLTSNPKFRSLDEEMFYLSEGLNNVRYDEPEKTNSGRRL